MYDCFNARGDQYDGGGNWEDIVDTANRWYANIDEESRSDLIPRGPKESWDAYLYRLFVRYCAGLYIYKSDEPRKEEKDEYYEYNKIDEIDGMSVKQSLQVERYIRENRMDKYHADIEREKVRELNIANGLWESPENK